MTPFKILLLKLAFYLLAHISAQGLHLIAWLLSHILARIPSKRRHIIQTNLQHCFQYKGKMLDNMLRENIYHILRAILERGHIWRTRRMGVPNQKKCIADFTYIQRQSTVHGLHLLDEAGDQACILMGLHMAGLEAGGYAVLAHSQRPKSDFACVYMPMRNPKTDAWLHAQRAASGMGVFKKSAPARQLWRFLQAPKILNMNADMDFGARGSLFLPFLGQMAAINVNPLRLAYQTGAKIVMMVDVYDVKTHHHHVYLDVLPLTGDVLQDAQTMQSHWDAHLQKHPSQYWWAHRRFKTHMDGKKNIYEK